MLALHVKYRSGKAPEDMEFPSNSSIKEVISTITTKFNLPLHYPYVLYNPQTDPLSSNAWLSPTDSAITLSSFKANDTIELRCEPMQMYILHLPEKDNLELGNIPLEYLNSTKKAVMTDFAEPLHEVLPATLKLFPVKKKENKNYCILKVQVNDANAAVVGMLNINISLQEARIHQHGHVLVVPLDYFNRPASSISSPTYAGYLTKLTKKGEKITKSKKYWFIQKYNILYYYHSKTGSECDGLIDLEYMIVSEKGNEVHLTPFPHYNNILAPIPDYFLVPEDGRHKEFFQSIWKHSASGAGKHLFGVSLASLWERKYSGDVPTIVSACVEYIRIYGINTVGIMTENGKPHIVSQLREDYDMGKEMDLIATHPDALSVGGLLKEYLCALPEPLLTYKQYQEFWANRQQTERLMKILGLLPGPQQLLIKLLFDFFGDLLRHSEANRLTLAAISQTFSPMFLRPRDEEGSYDATTVAIILATLIENREQFTPQPRHMTAKKSQSNSDLSALASPVFALPKNYRGHRPSFTPLPSGTSNLDLATSPPKSPLSGTTPPSLSALALDEPSTPEPAPPQYPSSPELHTPPPAPASAVRTSPPSSPPLNTLAPGSPALNKRNSTSGSRLSSRFTASMRLTPATNALPIPIFTPDPTQTPADQAQAAANAAAAAAADAARAAAEALAMLDNYSRFMPDDPDGVQLGAPPPPPPIY